MKTLSLLERIAEQRSSDAQFWSEPVPAAPSGEAVLSLGYRRFRDFDEPHNAPGQDFAAVRAADGHVVGLVVDGVSQSFFGDLAARELGRDLLEFLWDQRQNPPTQEDLITRLDDLQAHVHQKVKDHPIAAPEGSILRLALEETREEGTQAVFAAFILQPGTQQVILYQLGDVYVWLQGEQGQWTERPCNPRGRWSSIGRKHQALTRSEDTVRGILLHSDGLCSTWAKELGHPAIPQDRFVEMAEDWARRDDVSFVSASTNLPVAPPDLPPAASLTESEARSVPAEQEPDAGAELSMRQPERADAGPSVQPPPLPGSQRAALPLRFDRVTLTLVLASALSFLLGFLAGFASSQILAKEKPASEQGGSSRIR